MARIISIAVLFAVAGIAAAQPGPAKKYRFPELMLIVYADFPNEPEHQEAMARYTLSKDFNCIEAPLEWLEPCRKAGLMVRLGDIDVNKLLKVAPKLKDDPIVFGYFVSDRRTRSAFPGFAQIARDFEKADPNHPTLFINRAEYNQFPEFVDVVKPMVLDYYHYHWYRKNHPERYFLYLKMFRDLAVKHDIPQMRCLGSNNPPAQIRQSIYVPLAYGVQAFHFWPPWFVQCKLTKERNAVLENGKPVFSLSDPGKIVSEIGGELKVIGPTLLKLGHDAVYHTPPLAIGAEKAPDDAWVRPEGDSCLVGLFHDEQKNRYLMPVNHAVDKPRQITLRFTMDVPRIECLDRKTKQWTPLKISDRSVQMTLAPGDGELLRVTSSKK